MFAKVIPFTPRHFLIAVSLGLLVGCQDERAENTNQTTPEQTTKHTGAMVLALSWQAGFCETRPRLRECKSQKTGRYDLTHFSLHGLWPQPRRNSYCGVSEADVAKTKKRRWKQLDSLNLSTELMQNLERIMPGTRSYLHRYQWAKHGTCYSKSAETYFEDSVTLMEAVNASPVQKLFADNIGRRLSNNEIREVFDDAFGQGVGERVRVACKRDGERTIITELTLGLKGKITSTADIGALALASPKSKPGCPAGIVDAVGLQ